MFYQITEKTNNDNIQGQFVLNRETLSQQAKKNQKQTVTVKRNINVFPLSSWQDTIRQVPFVMCTNHKRPVTSVILVTASDH